MADEIVKGAEFKGMKKNDGEDPLIVAQRFLNIFKQLHIFNNERKDNFNEMLLDLKPEIRGMFASLPGGSLLQEYVDDLEKKSGNVRDRSTDSKVFDGSGNKDNILQTALKEASQQKGQGSDGSTPHPSFGIGGDGNFAKEMAQALKEAGVGASADLQLLRQALQINEEGRRRETAEITRAINESQMKMAQMLVQNNTNNSSNNANNIQIHTSGGNFPPVEEMVNGIVRAQSELFSNMAKTQTKELSSIISLALRESHQLSTKSIIDALTAFQRENLRILGLGKGDINFDFEQGKDYSTAGSFGGLSTEKEDEKDEFLSKKEKKKKKKNKNKDREKENSSGEEWGFTPTTNSKFSLDPSLFEFGDGEKQEKKKGFSFFDKFYSNNNEKIEAEEDDDLDSFFEEDTQPEDDDFEGVVVRRDVSPSENFIPEEEIEEAIADEAEDEEFEQEESLREDDRPFEPDESFWSNLTFTGAKSIEEAEQPIDLDKADDIADEKGSKWGFIEEEKKNEAELSEVKEEEQKEEKPEEPAKDKKKKEKVSKKVEAEEEWEWQDVEDDQNADLSLQNEEEPVGEDILAGDDDDLVIYDNFEGDTNSFAVNEDVETEEEESFKVVDKEGIVAEDYGTKLEPQEEEKEDASEEDWEWEYEDTPEETSAGVTGGATAETTETPTQGEGEWEWEYEDTPEETSVDVTGGATAETTETPTQGEGEWEWEYEEVPEDGSLEETQKADTDDVKSGEHAENTQNDVEDEGEWEWEYEEVPEDEAGTDSGVAAIVDNEAAKVVDDGAVKVVDDGIQAGAEDEGEWEWEYEEVPEEDETHPEPMAGEGEKSEKRPEKNADLHDENSEKDISIDDLLADDEDLYLDLDDTENPK